MEMWVFVHVGLFCCCCCCLFVGFFVPLGRVAVGRKEEAKDRGGREQEEIKCKPSKRNRKKTISSWKFSFQTKTQRSHFC